MQLQIWLHLPAPAKTQCRMNDPETHPEPVVFSTENFQEGSLHSLRFDTLTIRIYQVEGGRVAYPRGSGAIWGVDTPLAYSPDRRRLRRANAETSSPPWWRSFWVRRTSPRGCDAVSLLDRRQSRPICLAMEMARGQTPFAGDQVETRWGAFTICVPLPCWPRCSP